MGRLVKGWIGIFLMVAVVGLGAAGCATMDSSSSSQAAASPTLYKRLGGREGIALVVGDFVTNMAGDPRVNERFKGMKPEGVEKLKSNLADQICDATGGPCSYLGRDMKTVHAGMKITEAEWNATVDNLTKALQKHKVGAKEQQELIASLAPMKGDIVGR